MTRRVMFSAEIDTLYGINRLLHRRRNGSEPLILLVYLQR